MWEVVLDFAIVKPMLALPPDLSTASTRAGAESAVGLIASNRKMGRSGWAMNEQEVASPHALEPLRWTRHPAGDLGGRIDCAT